MIHLASFDIKEIMIYSFSQQFSHDMDQEILRVLRGNDRDVSPFKISYHNLLPQYLKDYVDNFLYPNGYELILKHNNLYGYCETISDEKEIYLMMRKP